MATLRPAPAAWLLTCQRLLLPMQVPCTQVKVLVALPRY
eukprot:COSAG04_NODE_19928_length_405_cov_0.669935_1_plen_38_part_01